MSQPTVCPKCKAILQDDYGMVTCPKCDSILFIDMDGVAHMGSSEEAPSPHPEPVTRPLSESVGDTTDAPFDPPKFDDDWAPMPDQAGEPEPDQPAPVAFSFDESAYESAYQPSQTETVQGSPDAPDFFQSNEELAKPSYEPEQPPVATSPAEAVATEPAEDEFSMESFMGGHVEPSEENGAAGGNQFSNPDDPLDLNDFANSEISQAKDGHLLFRLFIDGIDSKEIRDSLREAITDQRFAWDATRIMANITKGKLKIDQLPPVKAVILVNRIKRLPIQIRWEQYEITQSDEP